MKRVSLIRRYAPRFFATLALVGMIVYIVYHVTGSSEELTTTPARHITDVQLLSADAYLFRDETVIPSQGGGLVQSVAQSGTKVSKGAPLAEVYAYSGETLADAQADLDMLNRYIAILENSVPPVGSTLADARLWKAEANNCHLEILRAAQSGELSGVRELENGMLALLNRHQALTADQPNSAELLTSLKQTRATMLGGASQTIYNERASGYFYDRTAVDGYEEIFSAAALETLTVSSFDALVNTAPQTVVDGSVAGKMTYGYEWYLAIRLESAFSERFEAGISYRVTFSDNDDRELILTCDRVLREDGVDGAVAVFSCGDFPSDFSFFRVQRVKLSIDSMSGYYVPESALHNVNGVDGVYIFESRMARFRRVEILYWGDGYCIVAERGDRGEDYLNLNDILITYGQNLYDGKVY